MTRPLSPPSPAPEPCEREAAVRQLPVFARALRGDLDALRFVDDVFHLTQIWDDLVDGDRPVGPEAVNRAFWLALVELPQNPFYLRHMADLRPILREAVAAWFDANELEKGTAHERTVAFVLRDAVGAVVTQCAYLVGGYAWMREVAPEVRRAIHDEPLGRYLRGLR